MPPDERHSAEYVVLPRAALFEFFGEMALPPWPDREGHYCLGGSTPCAPLAEKIVRWVEAHEIHNGGADD